MIYLVAGLTGALLGTAGAFLVPSHPILAGIVGGLTGAWIGAYVTR